MPSAIKVRISANQQVLPPYTNRSLIKVSSGTLAVVHVYRVALQVVQRTPAVLGFSPLTCNTISLLLVPTKPNLDIKFR